MTGILINSSRERSYVGIYILKACVKKFYQENSNIAFSEYLTAKYGLWVDTRLSRDSRLHGNGRLVNSGIKLQR